MNKHQQRLKALRRQERQAERDAEKDELYDRIMAHRDKKKLKKKKFDRNTVWKVCRELAVELTKETILHCVVVTMHCLHREYGIGQVRLMKYAHNITHKISVIGNDKRDIKKLADELKTETGVDVISMFDGYEPYNGAKPKNDTQNRRVCLMERVPMWFMMCLYSLYYDYGWKHKRIERIANQIKPVLIDCVENGKIEYYKEYLKEKCKLTITSSGMVMAG